MGRGRGSKSGCRGSRTASQRPKTSKAARRNQRMAEKLYPTTTTEEKARYSALKSAGEKFQGGKHTTKTERIKLRRDARKANREAFKSSMQGRAGTREGFVLPGSPAHRARQFRNGEITIARQKISDWLASIGYSRIPDFEKDELHCDDLETILDKLSRFLRQDQETVLRGIFS